MSSEFHVLHLLQSHPAVPVSSNDTAWWLTRFQQHNKTGSSKQHRGGTHSDELLYRSSDVALPTPGIHTRCAPNTAFHTIISIVMRWWYRCSLLSSLLVDPLLRYSSEHVAMVHSTFTVTEDHDTSTVNFASLLQRSTRLSTTTVCKASRNQPLESWEMMFYPAIPLWLKAQNA